MPGIRFAEQLHEKVWCTGFAEQLHTKRLLQKEQRDQVINGFCSAAALIYIESAGAVRKSGSGFAFGYSAFNYNFNFNFQPQLPAAIPAFSSRLRSSRSAQLQNRKVSGNPPLSNEFRQS